MIDLDAKVRGLVERGASRNEIILELDAIANAAETRAKKFARGKKDQRHRAQEERAIVERIERILFFLRHGTPAFDATEADYQLYEQLKKFHD